MTGARLCLYSNKADCYRYCLRDVIDESCVISDHDFVTSVIDFKILGGSRLMDVNDL